MTLEEAAIANGWASIRDSDGTLVWRAEEIQPGEVWAAAVAAERERCQTVLADLLDFLERHSNRWDGSNGKHPHEMAEEARAILKA